MKNISKLFLTIVIFIGMSNLAAAQTVVEKGDITVGGGLTFTTGVRGGGGGEIGVNANGFYSITDEIRAGAGLSLFFGDFSPTQFNIDGHYLFINEDGLVVYALAGLGFWSWSFEAFGFSTSVSTSGLNLGGGIEYDLGDFYIFGEPKLTTIGGTPINITGGLRFRF